jgi:hypothetical protein
MATEKIIVGIDDKVIELKGADKEAFIAQREADKLVEEQRKAEQQALKQTKISAYTKLGLTEEEINAIL